MQNKPYNVRITDEQRETISVVAKYINLTFPDTVRKAIDFGLPVLMQRLKKK